MAGETYIKLDRASGILQEMRAPQVSLGGTNAGDIPALDAGGRLDLSMMPIGIAPDAQTVITAEALEKGDLVYSALDGADVRCFKAHAGPSGNAARGFVDKAYNVGDTVLIYWEGPITGLSGLIPNKRYYLSETPGKLTDTPVGDGGKLHQFIGTAFTDSELNFEPSEEIRTVAIS